MGEEMGRPFGRYVPISSGGHVRLYLPLDKCASVEQLRADGYDVSEEGRGLIRLVRLIQEAEGRRAMSEHRKRVFVLESLRDYSRAVESIDVICPYCLGSVNENWPSLQGETVCGWYDQVSDRCDGNASYTIDRANLVLGIPEVERYTCPARGTHLSLAIYDFDYLREEVDRRSRAIRGLGPRGKAPSCDIDLARILPLRISLERTRPGFRELILDLMNKDALNWVNTLSLEELASLLDRSAGLDIGPKPGQESDR
jgi:hypothetical protein